MNLSLQAKKIAAKLGFRIVRVGRSAEVIQMTPSAFADLTRAYEALHNRAYPSSPLPSNSRRSALLAQLLGTPVPEAYAIVKELVETSSVAGDVCEFGVAQGSTSVVIANEIAASGRHLHLFDSFEGMPRPTDQDDLQDDAEQLGSLEAYAGKWAYPSELVVARLRAIHFPQERVHIHAGFIEDVLSQSRGLPTAVSFAYVDFDFHEPIRAALNFLDTVLTPGGVVVVDDYDFFSTGAKAAVDGFVADHGGAGRYELSVAEQAFGHFAILRRLRE